MIFSFKGGRRAAEDDEVRTNRFTEACFEAASSAFKTPFTTLGMTALGSGFMDTSDAWINSAL
jgi:hypothetical protein